MQPRRLAAGLALASFAVLFQELALIRWLPSAVRVLAYFPNLILIGAFLGLGIGCLRAGKRSLLWLWPVGLLLTALAAIGLGRIRFTQESTREHLWLLYTDLTLRSPVVNDVRPPILIMFVLSALCFVPPGQLIAERLDEFRKLGKPLQGYSWDLAGSLAGTAAFALACFGWTRPLLWFSVVAAASLVFLWSRPRLRLVSIALLAAALVLIARGSRPSLLWSPYYDLATFDTYRRTTFPGTGVTANGAAHQYIIDLGSNTPRGEVVDDIRAGYRIPYRRLAHKPRNVLVLGAGTGNDVAVALAEGAEHIDAVEIDPGIVRLGEQFHPNRPYQSPRVRVFVRDARSFLQDSRGRYDLIVFGTLDSMTRLSALSSVRLDNFVYTTEALRAARSLLSDDGGMALYFQHGSPFIDQRLLATLAEAFESPPAVVRGYHQVFNVVYLAGPAFSLRGAEGAAQELARAVGSREPATDDWPYLYLEQRGISRFYLSVMAAIAVLALIGIALASPELRRSAFAGTADTEMFLLGLGFLLLETRAVTEMTLLWGVSWLTSAVVFGAILVMALLGTLASARRPLPWSASLVLLAVCLLLGYLVPTGALLASSPWLQLALSVAFVGPPVFFAATLFAALFQARENAGAAFGWNLLGAVAGGLLEFSSMAVGIKALHLLALAAYLGVGLVRLRSSQRAHSANTAA